MLILPNLKAYNDDVLKKQLSEENTRHDAEKVIGVIIAALEGAAAASRLPTANGTADDDTTRDRLVEKIGDNLTDRVLSSRHKARVVEYLLKANTSI